MFFVVKKFLYSVVYLKMQLETLEFIYIKFSKGSNIKKSKLGF